MMACKFKIETFGAHFPRNFWSSYEGLVCFQNEMKMHTCARYMVVYVFSIMLNIELKMIINI